MLILSRKLNESIVIDGRIRVKVVRIEGEQVKLGIEAPNSIPVHRQEVYEEIQRSNQEALNSTRPAVPRLARGPVNGTPMPGGVKLQVPEKVSQDRSQ